MSSRRCALCLTEWPAGSIKHKEKVYEFKRCPECGEATWSSATGQAIPHAEAVARSLRAAFERFYDARERKRQGPSPEELGSQEAREIIALERNL